MTVELRPWTEADIDVLRQANSPSMTTHLGGPEPDEKIEERNRRYARDWETGASWMFRIDVPGLGDAVGSVGYWPSEWDGEEVYEMGWAVAEPWQGRGIATDAVRRCLEYASRHGELDRMTAFPLIENTASNAICRKTGFELLGQGDFPGRRGDTVRVNVWARSL